jgi:hypothetical protein
MPPDAPGVHLSPLRGFCIAIIVDPWLTHMGYYLAPPRGWGGGDGRTRCGVFGCWAAEAGFESDGDLRICRYFREKGTVFASHFNVATN